MKKIYILFALSTFALFSCEKVVFDKTNLDKPIVDGIVYANHNPQIHLSSPLGYGEDNTSQTDINNAKVSMEIDGKSYDLSSKGSGNYLNDKVILKAGQVLNLKVIYNGYTVTASTSVPAKPKNFTVTENQLQITTPQQGGFPPQGGGGGFAQIAATWNNDIQEYYALMAKNVETTPEQVPFFGRGGQQQQAFTPPLEQITNPTQSNTANVGRQTFQYYGKYKLILFKVNGEYVDLFNNRGQSSLNLTNPPTNVTNGFGVFTAMNADTLNFTVLK